MENGKKQVPIKEGIFEYTGTDNKVQVYGSECASCGERHYPLREMCQNCTSVDMKKVLLSQTGTIKSYSVVRIPNPLWKGQIPYIIVDGRLDGGGIVRTHLTGCDPDNVPCGAKVELVAEKVFEKNDADVMAHVFKLV